MAQQLLECQVLLIIKALRSHFRHTTLGRTTLDEGPARLRRITSPKFTILNCYKRCSSLQNQTTTMLVLVILGKEEVWRYDITFLPSFVKFGQLAKKAV